MARLDLKDPSEAAGAIKDAYAKLGGRLHAFAGKLEQIGAPNTPNGKRFTDAYINFARNLADAFDKW